MKKINYLLISLLLSSIFAYNLKSQNYNIKVEDVSTIVGEQFEVNVNTSELLAENIIASHQFDIKYDKTLLEYVGYSIAGTICDGSMVVVNSNVPGILRTVTVASNLYIGAGSIFKLQFKSLSCVSSTIEISNFYYGADPIINLQNGSVSSRFKSTISANNVSAIVGNNFTTSISSTAIPNTCGVNSYHIKLSYDPTHIKYVNYNLVGTLAPSAVITLDNASPGIILVDATNLNGVTGSGKLINLEFSPIIASTSTLQINEFKYDNNSMTNLLNGQINTNLLFGNVDNDTLITGQDASLVLINSVGLSTENLGVKSPWENWRMRASDVNGDNLLNSVDVSLIMQHVAGLITKFPVESNIVQSITNESDAEIKLEGNYLAFYSTIPIYGFDILSVDGNNAQFLANPEKMSDDWLIASNINNNIFRVALATPTPKNEEHSFLRIPFSKESGELTFKVLQNGQNKSLIWKSQTTSINKLQKSADLNTYPNPVINQLKVDFSIESAALISLKLVDLNGRTLNHFINKELQLGKHQYNLDFTPYPSGLYILEFAKDGIISTKQIVKRE